MAANTLAEIRTYCHMPSSTPTDDELTVWTTLIREVIGEKFPDASQGATNLVELNTIKHIWDNRIVEANKPPAYPKIKLVTDEENIALLQPALDEDNVVDTFPTSGKRYDEITSLR